MCPGPNPQIYTPSPLGPAAPYIFDLAPPRPMKENLHRPSLVSKHLKCQFGPGG